MSLIPAANYGSPNETYFITRQDVINPLPIPGPAGPQGAVGPAGPQGLSGVNAYGSWYYAAMGPLPPAPQTVQWNGTDIYFSLVSIPPGGSDWLYSLKTQFQSIGTVTLYINSTDIGGNDIGWTASVTAVNFFEPLGYAQFTYVPASPIPIGFVAGNVVRVFDGGGSIGPAGPAGPAGPIGPPGVPGSSGTVTIGTTTTLAPGSAATVTNTGTPSAAILNFGIPEGDPANAATWSSYPATQQVEMANQVINNVNTINTGAIGVTNIDCYQTAITGYGTLQVGSPISLAPNPGTVNVNGTLTVQRGFSNFYVNAAGIEYDGTSNLPGPTPTSNSVKFGTLPVSGVNTLRFEMNTATSPAAMSMFSPSYITIDAAGAADLAAGAAVGIAAGGVVTIESAAKDITLQGSGGTYSDVHMKGGTLDGMGNITGQLAGGVALGNVNAINGFGSLPINVSSDLSGGVGVDYTTIGDVVSSRGLSTETSLTTVGTRVRFRDSTEFFVSNNGSDVTGDGSMLNPYATIQNAITQAELISSAANICVINVASGHYTETLTFNKGYVMLNGVLSTQTANEVTEITGSINISCAGAADLFNRQVVIQGFNITCGAGQLVTDNSTTSHQVSFQDCKIFTVGRFFNGISTGADARTYFTNCEINQNGAAITDSTIRVILGSVELERVDITTEGPANCVEIGGTAILTRCGLCTFENTNATGAAIVQISSSSTAIQSFGSNSFTYTNPAAKAAGAAIAGIYINSGVNTTLILTNNIFNLAGTSSSTNFVVSYNGVGSPTVLTYGNMAAYLPPTINYANTIQTGITRTRYWDPAPMNSGAWSFTLSQPNAVAGATNTAVFNTTESPAGQGGITLLANTQFYPTNSGTYQVTYTATFTNSGADADVYFWAALSGTRIGRSALRQTVANNHRETVTKTITFNMTTGQYLSFQWLSAGASVSAETTNAGGAGLQPAVPSFYVSIVQVA